jgi:hypothetical protein
MSELGLPEKHLSKLKGMIGTTTLTRDEVDKILAQLFFNSKKKQKKNRRVICEAAAIVYYQNSEHAIKHLMTDDAPQFNLIADHHSLCWVHEGRHLKKLNPVVPMHRQVLDDFIEQFWDYYGTLLDYKSSPSETGAQQLSIRFDELFSLKTGYEALDDRIALTLGKKGSLLLVLKFPFLPLNNNPSELGARVQARIRDINLQTISENGTKTKDTFATIVQTAKKLGVNIYDYIYDRVSKNFRMPSLADLIIEKAAPGT